MAKMTAAGCVVLGGCVLMVGACGLTGESAPAPDNDGQQHGQNAVENDDNDDNDQPENDDNGDNDDSNGNSADNDESNDPANNDSDDPVDAADRVLDLVTSEPYTDMVVEVDYVSGRLVRDGVADRVVDAIEPMVDKPGGIEVVFDDEIAQTAPDGGWTFDDLLDLRDEYIDGTDDTAFAYTMLVDGEYADSEGTVLGIAWSNRYSVLFMDEIEQSCQAAALPTVDADTLCEHAEVTVWRHELGHVLGLVDNGAPMQTDHEDDDSAHHCDNDDCVMYWAYRRPDMFDRLLSPLDGDPEAADFDTACREDLQALHD